MLRQFVNKGADEAAREYPDRMVGTLACPDTAAPPKRLRAREIVQLMWCSIGTCFLHSFADRKCAMNTWHVDQLREWSRKQRRHSVDQIISA